MVRLIGRGIEKGLLEQYITSGRSEFVAIYGRRRIGKTFLVTETLGQMLDFDMTGVINGDMQMQLASFSLSLSQSGYTGSRPRNWMEAFTALRKVIESRSDQEHVVVFIDEMPCLDTPKSGFVPALDLFWNGWASRQPKVKLIVCGSATTWMVDNIIDSHGGLHNRITHEIHLHPFTLRETEAYLLNNGFQWNRLTICQAYMILGGVPYYLSLLDNTTGLPANIDRLFFAEDAELAREYDRLFSSLFRNSQPYTDIIRLLTDNRSGLTRKEMSAKLKIESGGSLSRLLTNLENCDFIRKYNVRERKINSNNGIYQLTDFYVRFYNDFCRNHSTDNHYWSNSLNTPKQNNWFGLAYERLCMAHVQQIKKALGISGIRTEYYSWRSKKSKPAAQIDLIIERADNIVNLCEVKYSRGKYTINAEEEEKLRNRITAFEQETSIRKAVQLTMISTYGLNDNAHSSDVAVSLDMNALFG
jgi:AAA+ ATPase superfamily predicted ATPase